MALLKANAYLKEDAARLRRSQRERTILIFAKAIESRSMEIIALHQS